MSKQHIGSHNVHTHPDGYMPPRSTDKNYASPQRAMLKKIQRKKDRQRGKKAAENGET